MPANASSPSRLASPPAPPATQGAGWAIRLLGAVEARSPAGHLVRLPARAAVLLLARLALAPDRLHPREELVDLLWPGVALDVGRNRLRQALSTLKSLLELEGAAPVILADRLGVRAVPGALQCDARDFEAQLRAGIWERADQLYRGDLLPGYYDDWVIEERGRLAQLAERLQTMPRLPPSRPAARPGPDAPAPGQLPAFWTRLFGTEINASRLRELVRSQRLVTVFGAGGSGKTRLAVEAARALAEPSAWAPQGQDEAGPFTQVVFVSLVDCSDEARALHAMAAALRVQGSNPLQGIAAALAGSHSLLVLDNYEQLVGRADGLLQRLLTDCATLHLLVTSRQRLGIDGEQVFELAGLPLPKADDAQSGQAALALFVDRARAAAPDFVAAPAQAGAIADLVRLLAGMPLAIELAASRMRSLSPQALLGLLCEGSTPMLDLLSRDSGAHSMAQRHASLRHVVDWSWRQLGPALVPVMQALAAFAAPAGVGTVAAVAQLDARAAADRLEQLRDHSLLVAQRDADGLQRYVLLQPVREFVVERTDASVAAAMRSRLRQWLIDFGQRCAVLGHASIDEVEAEMPLVQAAILGAAADGAAAQVQAVQIAVGLRRHWEVDNRAGLPLALIQALDAALPVVTDDAQRCQVLVLLSFSKVLAGLSADGVAQGQQAVALAVDPRHRAHALLRLAQALMFSHSDRSTVDAALAEALAQAELAGEVEAQALALRMQFVVAGNRDQDYLRCEAIATRVQALWEQIGHRRNAYSGLMDRASVWVNLGRLDEASTALAACEQAALQERYATGHIMASWQLGRALIRLRRFDPALAAFRRCLQASWEHKRLAYAADALLQVPGGLAFTGQAEDAARLMGFAVPHWQRQFGSFYRELERDLCSTRRWLRQHLGPVRFEALRLEGACLSVADAVALGLGRA